MHVPAFRMDSRCIVRALGGRDLPRTAAAAAALDIPQAYSDWHALVNDAEIDAVSIAVPPTEQCAIVVEAARRGKHVFCEKPLGVRTADAEAAVAAVRSAGVVHAINFIFPELRAWQLARDLIQGGRVGVVRHFTYTWRVQTFSSRTGSDSWKNRLRAGGGAAGNFLPHALFNLSWLLGPIQAIDPLPRRRPRSVAFSDCVAYFAGDIHGLISISTDAPFGGGHRLEIQGDRGALVLSNPTSDHVGGFQVSVGLAGDTELALVADEPIPNGPDSRIAPAASIVRRFLDAIDGGTPVQPNLEHGLEVQRWLERVMVDPHD